MINMMKEWFGADRPHMRFLCVIFIVAALNVFMRLNFLPITVLGDAPSYLNTARFISGEEVDAHPGRLLKPLAPLGIATFALLFHGDMILGFLILNTACYFLIAVAMYALLLLFTTSSEEREKVDLLFRRPSDDVDKGVALTTERALAMLGTLVFISAYPMLEYGLDLYSDIGAWLLFVLALIGAVRYYRFASWKNFSLAASAIVLGLLWKEYGIPAGIFFGLILLVEPTRTWKEKFSRIFVLGAFSLVVVGIMQWVVYTHYHYTYIDFFREAGVVPPLVSQYTLYFITKSFVGVFLLGWGLVFAGLWHWRSIPRGDQWMLALLFPPSVMFLLWTSVSSRLYFLLAPLLALLATHGLKMISARSFVRILLTVVVILGSYTWLFMSGTFRAFLQ